MRSVTYLEPDPDEVDCDINEGGTNVAVCPALRNGPHKA